MGGGDVYDVLKSQRGVAFASPARPAPEGGLAPRGPSLGARLRDRLTRDRVLLAALVFVLYSASLLGVGIAIGRGSADGGGGGGAPAPAASGSAATGPYVTVRALALTAGSTERARRTAQEAAKALRARYPQYPVFDFPQGRDLFVCVGRFPLDASAAVQAEVRRLREEIAGLSFGTGKEKRRFEQPVIFKVQP